MGQERYLIITEVAAKFLGTLPSEDRESQQQELNKFMRWCGMGRSVEQLSIQEIAEYAESVGTSGADVTRRLEPVRAFLAFAKKEGLIKTNLAIHLRAPKSSTKTRPTSSKFLHAKAALTPEGHAQLERELASLKDERPQITEQIRLAAADKDFKENAPLDAAREHQGLVEARIKELEATLSEASILRETREKIKAGLGNTIVLTEVESGRLLRYTLVSPSEANPLQGKISIASPLGKAMMNQAREAIVEVTAPVGLLMYRIEEIEA